MQTLREINCRLSLECGAGIAQLLIYAAALLILVVGIRKVATLGLSEAGLVFGILLVLILTVQAIIMGTLVGISTERRRP